MIYQKDRQYSLVVGKDGKGFELTTHDISFSVTKNSDNKKKQNKAKIDIFNLSEKLQSYLETPFIEVVLSVGYADIGMLRLFSGQATIVGTRKSGADTITEIQIDSLYTELNHKTVSKTAPPGSSIKTVIESLSKEIPDVKSVIFTGTNINKSFVDGYPMVGSPRQILDEISEAFEIEWQVDDGTLYVEDRGVSYTKNLNTAYVISETTGMIERPYFDNIEKQRGKGDKLKKARKGVIVKILLNPAIKAGSTIKIEYGEFTGFYKVESVKHSGDMASDTWYSDLKLATMIT